MPNCPHCGKEINGLGHASPEVIYYKCQFDEHYGLCYEPDHKIESTPLDGQTYFCPECCVDLFTTEKEAITFLKGEHQA